MRITIPGAFLIVAVALFAFGAAIQEEEPIVMALLAAAAATGTYIMSLRERLSRAAGSTDVEARIRDIEARLSLTEAEADGTNAQLGRLRAERDFDRQIEAGRGLVATRAIGVPE